MNAHEYVFLMHMRDAIHTFTCNTLGRSLLLCLITLCINYVAQASHGYTHPDESNHLAADNTLYITDHYIPVANDIPAYQEGSSLKAIAFNDSGEKDLQENFEPAVPVLLGENRPYKHKSLRSIDPQRPLHPPKLATAC